jgi:hypothetical protein
LNQALIISVSSHDDFDCGGHNFVRAVLQNDIPVLQCDNSLLRIFDPQHFLVLVYAISRSADRSDRYTKGLNLAFQPDHAMRVAFKPLQGDV